MNRELKEFSCRVCGRPNPGQRYCPEHKPSRPSRPNFRQRGYGSMYERNRKRLLKLHPRCARCGEPSTVAHHIIDKAAGGSDELTNLQALCKLCHDRHTAHTKPAGWHRPHKRRG